MIDWTQHSHLIEELASKRAIIFIGSGISAGAISKKEPKIAPPTWKGLLEKARDRFGAQEDKQFVTDLIAKGQLLDAAEIIFDTVSPPARHAFLLLNLQPRTMNPVLRTK